MEPIPKDKKILVVCDGGLFRSAFLEGVFKENGYKDVKSGGVGESAGKQATLEMLAEAEVIVVVHPHTNQLLGRKYAKKPGQYVVNLDVGDLNAAFGRTKEVVYSDLEEQILPYLAS